ncbi:MAG: hypothetical protein F2583_06640, partial [Actinobacteria bacterium]|nr:hypothetical protein [Actinomycetota bacterium]
MTAIFVILGRSIKANRSSTSRTSLSALLVVLSSWCVVWVIYINEKNSITQTDRGIQLFSVMTVIIFAFIRLTLELLQLRKVVSSLRATLQTDPLTSLPNREFVLEHLSISLQ